MANRETANTSLGWFHFDAGRITQQTGVSWTSVLDGRIFRYRGPESRMSALQAAADHVEELLAEGDEVDE